MGITRALSVLAVSLLLSAATSAAPAPARTDHCQRLYVFGDSYSDSGAGYVDGNGPTAVVYMAHELGLTLLPAPFGKATDSLNFAVSGANTGAAEGERFGRAILGRGVRNQVDDFTARVKSATISFDPNSTVFFIAGGLNDRAFSAQQTLDHISGFVASLHAAGARRFVIAKLPVRLISPRRGMALNPALPKFVFRLRGKYPDSKIIISDWGWYFDKVYIEAASHGFTNVKNECAGRDIFGQDPTPCADPRAHYFYYSGHPSTEVHRLVGAMLAREAASYCGPIAKAK